MCSFSAFLMYWSGCSSIYILAALKYTRYETISNQMKGLNPPGIKESCIRVAICLFMGLFWSIMPIFGWSYYSPEGLGTSCSIEWNKHSFNVLSYNITILAMVLFIPLAIIIYANCMVIAIVS